MKFTILREKILKSLQLAANVADKRQTLPILSNVLLVVKPQALEITATDSEVEIKSQLSLDATEQQVGEITVPAKKMLDLVKNLPPSSLITCKLNKERLNVTTGKSRFTLATLPAGDFPTFDDSPGVREFSVQNSLFKQLIDYTQFAMAQQDVRYYLNGLLFEITSDNQIKTIATDGHRLALNSTKIEVNGVGEPMQAIIPRKGVLELSRLLDDGEQLSAITLGENFIRVGTGELTFTSKLVDGRFPDVQRTLPQSSDVSAIADRGELKQVLQRAAILTNEKFHGVRLQLTTNTLTVLANNPDQEEAEEELTVQYDGADLDVGFNVTYILDALNALHENDVELAFVKNNNSILIQTQRATDKGIIDSLYLVMPMRV